MGILNHAEYMHEMFEMDKLLHHPTRKSEDYHEAACNTRETTNKENISRKEKKNGFTTAT